MKTILFILILILAGFAIFGRRNGPVPQPAAPAAPAALQQSAITGFEWSGVQQEADTEGMFWSDVYLTVRHADGSSEQKYIATVQGSCNDIDARERPALGSNVLQCYAAGFGDKFRVMDSQDAYLVQRQEFQEATPGDTSPIPEFTTILTLAK